MYLSLITKSFSQAILLFLFSFRILANEEIPKDLLKLNLEKISIKNKDYLSINFLNHPNWHTYWLNPGDAGLPIEIKFFDKNKELKIKEEERPTPRKFIEPGDLWAFGYSDQYSFFYELPTSFIKKYKNKELKMSAKWLICKHICIPGNIDLNFKITDAKIDISSMSELLLSPIDLKTIEERFLKLPKLESPPDYVELNLYKGKEEKTLVLEYVVKNTTDLSFISKNNLIFFYPATPFDFKHEQIRVENNSIIGTVLVSWDGEYQDPPEPLAADGKFKRPYKLKFIFNDPIKRETYILDKTFKSFNLNQKVVSTDVKTISNDDVKKKATELASVSAEGSLLYYLFMAFIGGLILNLMPCVLPIISLKLFSLIKYREGGPKKVFKHNVSYSIGILFTFLTLALTIILLKQFGTVVGWGFQLQSPNFIAIMIIILFIFSLNLFGLFEFRTPFGSKIGNLNFKDGFINDFSGGIIATILSTPCSAPFLGTALTFAFTSKNSTIILVFLFIGLGLAFPFILTALFPKMINFLPKPGKWMNTLKKLMGISLLLTIIWLLDVYNTLVEGQNHLIKLLTILIIIFGGFLLRKKDKWLPYIAALFSLIIFVNLINTEIIETETESALIKDKLHTGLNYEKWSYEKMDEYKRNKDLVFIDFTAKWCFTCKVNEKLVLETDGFKKLVIKHNMKLLIADWTKRDEVITRFLRENNLAGVPAYFIIRRDGKLIFLGETITLNTIERNL